MLYIRIGNSTTVTVSDIQVEYGNTATTYEPYTEQTQLISLGDIELCKIGDCKDRIYKENDKWWLEKNTGIKTTWGVGATAGSFDTMYSNGFIARYYSVSESAVSSDRSQILCNILKGTNSNLWNGTSQVNGINIGQSTHVITVSIDKNILEAYAQTTLTSENYTTIWSNYFTYKNTIAYYPLTEAVTTQITNETLVGQLENWLKMKTNRNITNMHTATDNEIPTLTVEYRKDLTTLFNNLNNAIISLGNNT